MSLFSRHHSIPCCRDHPCQFPFIWKGQPTLTTWCPACTSDKDCQIAAVTRHSTHRLLSAATSDHGGMVVRISTYQPQHVTIAVKINGKANHLGEWKIVGILVKSPRCDLYAFLSSAKSPPRHKAYNTRADRKPLRKSCCSVQKIILLFTFPGR